MLNTKAKWEERIKKRLEGRKIVEVRYMNKKEAEEMGFYPAPIVIFLDDGNNIFPQADDEGNNGGALSTSWEDLPIIPLMAGM